jgi:hypothetical protein
MKGKDSWILYMMAARFQCTRYLRWHIGCSPEAHVNRQKVITHDVEVWEDELNSNVHDPNVEIKSWEALQDQIKADLKKHNKMSPLFKLNQLMILSNFATLQLKGASHIQASVKIARQWHPGQGVWFACQVHALAWHYQIFEQLPQERRGGVHAVLSWLDDEVVKKSILDYLNNLLTGKVTPQSLQRHVNDMIFPEHSIKAKKSISIQMAQHWLIKLGWQHSTIKKGVYMDGHE